jgi:hypothetical protein
MIKRFKKFLNENKYLDPTYRKIMDISIDWFVDVDVNDYINK